MLITFDEIKKAEENQKTYDEGVYTVKIKAIEDKVSQNTGNEFKKITFETIGENVFEIKNNYFFTEKSLTIFLNLLSSIGLYEQGSNQNINFENEDLLGHVLRLELVLGEPNDKGKRYLEVKPWSCEPAELIDEIPF